MSSVAIHFASGAAFFSGSAALVAGLLLVTFAHHKLLRALGRLSILMGIFLIAMSATPLPNWAWCAWGAALVVWMAARLAGRTISGNCGHVIPEGVPTGHIHPTPPAPPCEGGESKARSQSGFSTAALFAVIACTLVAVAWELSWQVVPRGAPETLRSAGKPELPLRLVVIGDSLSAEDFTEGGASWPTLLAREHAIEVVNLAFSGAKAGSAGRRVTAEYVAGAVVLLEIGGNDLFGGTTPAEFERDLDALLTKVGSVDRVGTQVAQGIPADTATRPPLSPLAKGGREPVDAGPRMVVMLELPLPPLYNRFGEIQRRLARRHNVVLVPKRYFASVLIGEEATLDGLHLSPAGHRKMAAMVWEQVSRYLQPIRNPQSEILP